MLAAFEHWGVLDSVRRFNGMFAFALWDCSDRTLTLARDRFGEKPLYYCITRGQFLFASELKALRAHPHFTGEIDRGFGRALPAPQLHSRPILDLQEHAKAACRQCADCFRG